MTNPTLYGYTACPCIVASAPLVERRLSEAGLIAHSLSGLISQGCYSAGAVAASAGTHDGGGVLDLRDFTPYRADADGLFTADGWIAFYRPYGILYVRSPAHWHIVLNGCPHLATAARSQLTEALAGRNGLAGKGKDSGPRPGITWQQAVGAQGTTPPPVPPQEDHMSAAQVEALTALTQQVLDAVKGQGVDLADIPPLYLQLTGRAAVDAESQSWFVRAIGDRLTLRQVSDQIAASDEARRWAIASAYRAYLGREATPVEVVSWLAQGLSFNGILGAIAGSPEAKSHAAK